MAQGPETPDDPAKRVDFDELFSRYFKQVVNLFTHLGVPRDLAPDLAQETFLRAHKSWDRYRGEASEKTWLLEIARNLFKNWLRDRGALKKQGIEISLTVPASGDDSRPAEIELASGDPLPIDDLLAKEELEQMAAAVAQLPPQRRTCLKLRQEGLKYGEIAATMGLSIETVKSHLYQARESLPRLLGAAPGTRREK